MNPFFTVYIPFHTYGYAIKAKDALRSLDAQSFTSFETILIANGTSFPSWMNEGDIYKSTGVFGRKIIGGEYHTLGAAANAAIALAKVLPGPHMPQQLHQSVISALAPNQLATTGSFPRCTPRGPSLPASATLGRPDFANVADHYAYKHLRHRGEVVSTKIDSARHSPA